MTLRTPTFKSIGVRLFMLILAVMVPLAGFDLYNSSKEQKRRIDEVTHDLSGTTREAINKINDLIGSSEELLSGLAVTDEVQGRNLFSCTRVLHDVAAKFSKYTNFSLVNVDKYIVCSSGVLTHPKSVKNSPNIIQAFETKAFAISPLKFGVLTGKPVLVFSLPLLDVDGRVTGTLNNGLSLSWLGDYMAKITRHDDQKMVVFDGRGAVMASYPSALFKVGSSLENNALGQHILSKTKGAAQFTDENGEQVLASFAQIPRIPGGAYIAAFVPLDAVLAETMQDLYLRLRILLTIAGASLLLGWLGARVLVLDPIHNLTILAGKVEEGDFTARSELAYHTGELGTLALAYDRMVAGLEARTSALRESESHYRELVESEEQLIHRFLPDTTEVFVNQALADFFGGPPSAWVGHKWIDHVPREERQVVLKLLGDCKPDKPAYVFEHMAKNAAGEARWLRWNNRAFFDEQENITHFQAVAVDLTDRKRIEHNLELAMMEARAANRAKSNFIANMSHELRTPLNSIIGFSEMMTSGVMGKLPDTYGEYASFITSSGHHLLNIVNDILDLSKIEAGMLTLDEEEVNLGRETAEVLTMLQDRATKNGNELRNNLDRSIGYILRADRMRIKQVLLNLLSNAIKFTHNGTITVEAKIEDGATCLMISDTGIGMTQQDIEVALKPFGQVDGQHLNKRYEGTGLGLPLAGQLMEMHGGTLQIDSAIAKGTTIQLRFPADRTA